RGGGSRVQIEAVDRQEQAICVKFPEHGFCLRPDEGTRNGPEQPSDHDHVQVGSIDQFVSDIQSVSNDSDRLKPASFQVTSNFGGGGSRIQDYSLVVLDQFGGGTPNPCLLGVMQCLF